MIDVPSLIGALGLTPPQVALVVFAGLLVMGLANLVKALLPNDSRWVPLAVLAVGVLVMEGIALIARPPVDPLTALFIGLVLGLVASGLWSQGKTLFGPSSSAN